MTSDHSELLAKIKKWNDPQKLHNIQENARKRGAKEVEKAAFKRLIEVQSGKTPGSFEGDFWETIHAFEEIRRQERGRKVPLTRTRQKIKRVGVEQTLIDLVTSAKAEEGFNDLIERDLPEMTAEAVVLRHGASFDPDVLTAAKERLIAAGVDLEDIQQR